MPISNPFNIDAGSASELELTQLPPQGDAAITRFCGQDSPDKDWDERDVCVLKGRRGFGKSHLLGLRSVNHRSSAAAARTVFYPRGGHPRLLFDALSSLHAVVPRWLQGKDAVAAWILVWQLSILGLLAWVTRSKSSSLPGYTHWFGSLQGLEEIYGQQTDDVGPANVPDAMLTWFMGRVLERLPADDYGQGVAALQHGLYHANSDWAVAIKASITAKGKTRIAMYLDAPDELVEMDPPSLWRNVQQGLLLAIWKFAKNSVWSRSLNIYATVRSEAFGSGQDHADVGLALGLALTLKYSREQLEAMLNDRIRQADPARLSVPLDKAESPLHALCGFAHAVHEDRKDPNGQRWTESVFEAIVRHTRQVPRELIRLAGAIYDIEGPRTYEAVRGAVNAAASLNTSYAIHKALHGWVESLHGRFVASLREEVISGPELLERAGEFGDEGPRIIKFLIQHGLLGTAEPIAARHCHSYVQRFAFDEVHGSETSSSLDKDYFFVHPALKEWIRALPDPAPTFRSEEIGVIGDQLPYEAQPPLIRLAVVNDRVLMQIRRHESLEASNIGTEADTLRFLFLVIWGCREQRGNRIRISKLRDLAKRLRDTAAISRAIVLSIPNDDLAFGEKARNWAKKINRDAQVKKLQHLIGNLAQSANAARRRLASTKSISPKVPFMSVSAKSKIGAQVEVTINELPIGEVDWDLNLMKYVVA